MVFFQELGSREAMNVRRLAAWLVYAEGREPVVPKWLLPDEIYCDETQDTVWAALKEARKVLAQRDELLISMPFRDYKTKREADETIMEIARSLAEKLEITT
jgi:hypothetical protein